MHAGSGGWLSQTAQQSDSRLWHQQQQQPYQPESLYQPDSIYQHPAELPWQQSDFGSVTSQLPQSEQLLEPAGQPAYPPSSNQLPYQINCQDAACQQHNCQQSNYMYEQPSCQQQPNYQQPNCQQLNCQQPNCQQLNYQQPNCQQPNCQQPNCQQPNFQQPNCQQPNCQQPNFQQPNFQQPNCQQPNCQQPNCQQPNCQQPSYQQQPSSQQVSCYISCQPSCQSTCQSDLKAVYNRHWECDLYSLTEKPLAEVSISDADCPVCQWDRQFTRVRDLLGPPSAGPLTDWTPTTQRPARIDGASRILVSFNSQLAAIYIDASVGGGAHGGAGNSGEGRGGGGSGGEGGGSGAGSGLSIFPSSAIKTPKRLASSSGKETPSYARSIRPENSALPYRWTPPLPKSAARPQEAATPMPFSSEPESAASRAAAAAAALEKQRRRRRSSRMSDAIAKAATAAAAAAAPEPRQRDDAAFQLTSELSSTLPTPSTGGTPRPWTSGSGTAATAAPVEATGVTSTATSEETTTTGGAKMGGSEEASESGSGEAKPGKTTIQLLRFKARDLAAPGNAPKRIEPPHFVSQQRPENVVSGGASGDGFVRSKLARARSPQPQLQRTQNFSNSEVADESSNLLPSEAADRQKQIMADAMRLARLIEASWGLL